MALVRYLTPVSLTLPSSRFEFCLDSCPHPASVYANLDPADFITYKADTMYDDTVADRQYLFPESASQRSCSQARVRGVAGDPSTGCSFSAVSFGQISWQMSRRRN